jgi:hypothetical protein
VAVEGLRIRKRAERSADFVVHKRADGSLDHGLPWPLAGIEIVGKPPKETYVPNTWVNKAAAEGWLTLEGEQMVHRPGGPPEEPWRVTHTFRHADALVLHTADGDVRYKVVENPDKWPNTKNDKDEGFGGEVRWVYRLKLA